MRKFYALIMKIKHFFEKILRIEHAEFKKTVIFQIFASKIQNSKLNDDFGA